MLYEYKEKWTGKEALDHEAQLFEITYLSAREFAIESMPLWFLGYKIAVERGLYSPACHKWQFQKGK